MELNTLEDLVQFKDGEYFFKTPKNLSIKTLNFNKLSNSSCILVCFNAAVSKRSEKVGPFYSGLGVSNVLGIPTIAISDFVVTNNDVELAWYMGDGDSTDFQNIIAKFLDGVASFYNKSLVVFGGSGGGFASLAIASKLKCDTTVIAMNPQTSIDKYLPKVVKRYLEVSFPEKKELDCSNCQSFLERFGVISNVCSIQYPENISILYLQNKSDLHHVFDHMGPFILNKDIVPVGDNSYIFENSGLYLGEWGKGGHVSPDKDIIRSILKDIVLSKSISDILRGLENGLGGLNKNTRDLSLVSKYDYKLLVKARKNSGIIDTDVVVLHRGVEIPQNEYKLAVYLLDSKNNTLFKSGYSSQIRQLSIPDGKEVRVKVFLKDQFGRKIIGLSNRI